ncbi:hypothetical protein DFH07DRAFT_804156 [Mycena maculata]|uniref:Uncharacterized protein n=1 Tax=Mycena maculata TaxID=230809 RepID=A0AAD7NQN1_9AGAR|nr:hypothetical protein DFH07DRAFT_804156 [Mycena maculata]
MIIEVSTILAPMVLFVNHPIRSVASVVAALFIAHVVSLFVSFFHVFHLTQTSVAILAVSGLIFLITMHHRRDGHLLTQTQEEMVLIFSFGLFWMAMLLGWRALRERGTGSNLRSTSGLESPVDPGVQAVNRQQRPAGIRPVRPYPCGFDDAYCVVEDYTFF